MHPDLLLLAERLVVALEKVSQDVNNISAYVYDLNYNVSHFLNEKREKADTSLVRCDDAPSIPDINQKDSVESESSWQYEHASGSSADDQEHEETSLGAVASVSVDCEEGFDHSSTLTEGIKTEEEPYSKENYESCGVPNTFGNSRNNVRISPRDTLPTENKVNTGYLSLSVVKTDVHEEVKNEAGSRKAWLPLQEEKNRHVSPVAPLGKGYSEEINQQSHTEASAASCSLPTASSHSHTLSVDMRQHFSEVSFPVASCSTVDETVCQEEAVDIHLPKRREEQQAAEVRQRQFIDQSESARSTYSEVTCFAREMLRLTSSAGSEGRRRGFECSVCKQLCASNSALIVHMRVHTGERPYQCSWCEKAFRQRGDLTRHMRFHMNERPFTCSQCGKAFRHRGNLTEHMRIHTKSFRCDQCGKAFSQNYSLSLHKQTHTE